jgi:hypothetical protein
MPGVIVPRFKSREVALRFYFRGHEVLRPNAKPGSFSTRRPPNPHPPANIIDDLIALDSCFHGLNDVQLWLLHELYGPGGFKRRPRPAAEVLEAARRKFPKREFTRRRMAQFRQEALKIFEAHLERERLI